MCHSRVGGDIHSPDTGYWAARWIRSCARSAPRAHRRRTCCLLLVYLSRRSSSSSIEWSSCVIDRRRVVRRDASPARTTILPDRSTLSKAPRSPHLGPPSYLPHRRSLPTYLLLFLQRQPQKPVAARRNPRRCHGRATPSIHTSGSQSGRRYAPREPRHHTFDNQLLH